MSTRKVLVGCEFSGQVRQAFRDRGLDAWSCDLLPWCGNRRNEFQRKLDTIRGEIL
jgi:hypothetical protein